MNEITQKTLINTLLARHNNPQDIIATLAEISKLDYLDWEGLIEERESENRVANIFIPCSQCGIMSNRESWVPVKRSTSGRNRICADCARLLRTDHTYYCAWCNTSYISLKYRDSEMDVCGKCTEYLEQVQSQLSRARLLNRHATLTTKQWRVTLHHFEQTCAYCQEHPYECIEHYLPLTIGGGTTANNCIPSCLRCNLRKRDKHPNNFKHLFPSQNIALIQSYFETITMEVTHS